jgi:dTMP kinase
MARFPDGRALPGKLFVIEGLDGSGKSTQIDMLHRWLAGQGYCVAYSEWEPSRIVRQTTKRGKKKQLLTSTSFSLIHAADFADRMDRQMLPALKAGAIVLVDRYVYTAFARDVARGVHPQWVRNLYAFALQPTAAFYIRVSLKESLDRVLQGRPTLTYYEAGMDLGLSSDPYESFELFQGRILEEYEKIAADFGLTVVDATMPLLEQEEMVRQVVEPHLGEVLSAEPGGWQELLSGEGLQGRYLKKVFPMGERS